MIQFLPENLFLHGHLSTGCRFLQGYTHLLQHGVLYGLQGGYLLHCGPPRAAGEQPASLWSSPWAAGESLFWHLEQLLFSFATDLGVTRVVCLTFSLSYFTAAAQCFSPVLKYVITVAPPV